MDMVHALLELQEHDLALLRYAKQLDEMPEKRAILTARAKLADIEKLKARTDAAVHAIEQASRGIEDQIAAIGTKMEAEQGKLVSGQMSNPKELQSVSRELDALRRRVEALEADLLVQMQKRETGAAQAAKIDAALVTGHQREAELTARFKEHGGEILAHTESEKKARGAVAAVLDPALLERYEKARAARHGVGVGVLADGRCSACRVGLPAGKIAALDAGPDIGVCPGCGRILIVRGA
jgi:predicted  nucleic acid-binding Zn-ribbon protein